MAESKLDQIVKGAPPPNAKLPSSSQAQSSTLAAAEAAVQNNTTDPLSTLPSSPPQIYLNLLILEASLRSQYLTLRARRRQHTFFLLLLTGWLAWFFYLLFLSPREDGRGLGGSPYWVIEMAEKVALMAGIVTAILMWGTGQWERGMRWPRRWVGVANRGLRGINSKLVVIKGPWWREIIGALAFLFPYGSFFYSSASSYHFVVPAGNPAPPMSTHTHRKPLAQAAAVEEDLSPGGDYVKLLLLPKPFSPEFREQWEIYRAEYWDRENERRAQLRSQMQAQQRESARQDGRWLWWTGWRSTKHITKARSRASSSATVPYAGTTKSKAASSNTHDSHKIHRGSSSRAPDRGESVSKSAAARRPRKDRRGSMSNPASRSSSRNSSTLDGGGDGDSPRPSSSAGRRSNATPSAFGAGTAPAKGEKWRPSKTPPSATRSSRAAAAAAAIGSRPATSSELRLGEAGQSDKENHS